MNPGRVDFVVDLLYGAMIFLAVVLIVVVGTSVGVAFGLGTLVAYLVHVGWKMARFDPDWMTKEVTEEVTETIEETVTEEVTESVAEEVSENVAEEVTENVEEKVAEEVTENVERTLSDEVEAIIDQLEAVNERVDRRPRADEIDGLSEGEGDGSGAW